MKEPTRSQSELSLGAATRAQLVASDIGSLCMQTKGAELQIADRLLKSVLGQLLQPGANMADHVEGALPNAGGLRLQGKLRLCAALIRVLKRYSVGAPSGGGLVEKLLTGVCGLLHSCRAVSLILSAALTLCKWC